MPEQTGAALVLFGEDASAREWNLRWARDNPQIVDRDVAMRLGGAFCEGANLVATRLATALFPTMKYSDAWIAFVRSHGEPTYTQVRNFLEGDCNVAPVLAAHVALRCTRPLREVR